MYEQILLPTDGSDGTAAALEHALDLADIHDASVHVLFVVNTTFLDGSAADAITVESLRMTGEGAPEVAANRIGNRGREVIRETRQGEPYRGILDYADEADVDMIVMGTHGRRGRRARGNRPVLGATPARRGRRRAD